MIVEVGMTALVVVSGALVVVLASWLLAFVSEDIAEQLAAIDSRVAQSLYNRAKAVQGRLTRLSKDVRGDVHVIRPSELLSRLTELTQSHGDAIVKALERSGQALEENSASIDALGEQLATLAARPPDDGESKAEKAAGPDKAEKDEPGSGHGFWLFLFLAMTPIVIGVNTFILMEFFGAVFASGPVLPYPLPAVEIGDVIAVLFSLVEVLAGMLMHASRTRKDDRASLIFAFAPPVIMIAALCFVETIAYALLSFNIGMDANLGLTGWVAAPVRFFLAPFGFALPLLLANLGFQLGQRTSAVLDARAKRRDELGIDGLQKQLTGLVEEATEWIDALKEKQKAVLPIQIPDHGEHKGDVAYVGKLVADLKGSSDDTKHASAAQAWAAIAFDFLLSGALVFFGFAAYKYASFQLSEWLPPAQGDLAETIAIVLAVAATLSAFFLKQRLNRRVYMGAGLVSVVRMAHVTLLGLEALAVLLYAAIGAALRVVLFLAQQLVQFAALPGKVVRDSRGRPGPA